MNLEKYQELTGLNVSSGKAAFYQAQIRRTQSMLETLLGFTLDPDNVDTNFYNELGKTSSECSCPSEDISDMDLDDPDAVVGAYRLFDYNDLDQFLHIDPFVTINKVKLVYIKQGTGTSGVTLKTFTDNQIRVNRGREGFAKYLELCRDCMCSCGCTDCLQLAVDADWNWEETIPEDLLYVWADMVTYYSDQKRDIKSESITTHSYTRFDNIAPEAEPQNLSVIKRYAGPHGSATVTPTTGASGRRTGRWVYN